MLKNDKNMIKVSTLKVSCDGEINESSEGHPLVWLQINIEEGYVSCPYCDTKFKFDAQ